MMAGRHVRITGRVQGVFFRAWTAEQARALGVSGWVRNCPDGSVEAQLAGEPEAVGRLIKRMQRGPPGAKVEHLVTHEAPPETGGRFEVRH